MNTTPKKGGRMSKSKKYKIKQKDFKKLEKLALRRDSDKLNVYFINYPEGF